MMRSITSNKNKREKILAILFWLVLWQLASFWIGQELLLVPPGRVAWTLLQLVREADFWATVSYSLLRIVGGFLLAIVAGIVLAVFSAASSLARALLSPFFGVVKSVPVASFIILVLIWAGSGSLSVVISFLMVLPFIYTNVLDGILHTDPKLLEMAGVFRISMIRRARAIYMPQTMPYFRAACKVGLGMCWKSGIAAEVIGLPTGSIGERLSR